MVLSAIVAASENNAIGINNALPWHLPEDLKFFKRTTIGKPVIMGRKTYEALGKPLPGRLNIVLSRNTNLDLPESVLRFSEPDEAIAFLGQEQVEEAFIIGGGVIFKETMSLLDKIYMTRVHTHLDVADTFFPEIDHTHWKLTWSEDHQADEKHKFAFTFQLYERIEL